jgi:Predicted membrane protein
MRKNAFLKDSLRQVRATIHRFLAILVITALGVAFFAGLRASGPDMRMTASDYFDRLNFMDIRLVSTIGFNEDDILAVKNVEGVRSVMPAYSFDALVPLHDTNLTIRLHSLGETAYAQDAVNRPELTQGRMPESNGECLADPLFMALSGYSIGDNVRVVSGTADPVSDALKTDTFQIVGIAENPLYISYERGSGSVGSGKTDAYLLIFPTDFEYTVYTEVYLTIQNTASASRFDGAYGDLLEPVKDALEETGVLRADLRYEEIRSEARQELDDAKAEVADGYRELADARKELDDARAELDQGWQDYDDGLEEYNNEIADAQKELDDGQARLDQGWRDYYDAVDEFEQKISDAEKELADGYAQYESGRKEYEAGLSQYQSGLNEWGIAQQELEEGEAAYNAGYAEYTRGKEMYDTLSAALAAGNTPESLAAISMIASELAPTNPELSAVLMAYVQNPTDPAAAATAQGAAQQLGQSLEQSRQQLDAAKAELDAGREQLEAAREELSAAQARLNAAKEELDEAKRQLDEGSAELERSRDEGQRKLSDAKNELLDAEKELTDGRATLKKEKARGQKELDDALVELNDGEAEFTDGQNEFFEEQADALKELEDAQREIDDGEKELAELKLPEWFVLDHETNIGFVGYKQDAERVEALSLVVPVLFFWWRCL